MTTILTAVTLASLFCVDAGGAGPDSSGRRVHAGLKFGIPLNSAIAAPDPVYRAGTKWFTSGPSILVELPRGFALGADLLYKRIHYGVASGPERARGRWEAPILMRWYSPRCGLVPFAEAGVSFNWVTGASDAIADLRHRHTHGVCAGGGVSKPLRRVFVEFEIRLTHWVDRNFGTRDSALRSNLNQVEFLLGFRL